MPDYLLDSNVLIRHLRRHQSTTDLLAALILEGVILSKPDAIIGATAAHHDLILVTYNVKHFPMTDARLYEGMPE